MAETNLPAVERIAGDSGMQVAFRSWRPAGGAKAVVLIVPGFNSHSGFYNWTGQQLAAKGFAAYAVDLRGRGASDGERFYVDAIDDYVSDVEKVAAVVAQREAGKKLYILGHSAGGVVACVYALAHQSELAGLICESFAYQTPAPDFAVAALKGLSHLAPHAHVLKLANKDFSRDATAVEAMDADPLIANETQPTKTIAALARADDRLKGEFPLLGLPLLILHGTADKATKYQGSQFFFDTAGASDKTLKLYEGHYHDMLNDIGKEQVFGDIGAWLDARA